MVVTVTHRGYIKRTPLSIYKTQKRGGKGKQGLTINEEDFVKHLFISSTHSYLLIFTDIGKLYWLKVHQIPEAGRTAKGKPIVNLLPLQEKERATTILPVKEFDEGRYLAMATKRGFIKKTELRSFSNPRANGIIAIHLEEDDQLLSTVLTSGNDQIFLATKNGKSLTVEESQIRPMGRTARGVKAMTLRKGDSLIAVDTLRSEGSILTIKENGYGKRTPTKQYRKQNRGGIGLTNIKIDTEMGRVVNVIQAQESENIVIITNLGKLIRINASGIRVIGRNTIGVKLIDLNEDELVVAAQKSLEND
jgi:DNA gyrase subunit A